MTYLERGTVPLHAKGFFNLHDHYVDVRELSEESYGIMISINNHKGHTISSIYHVRAGPSHPGPLYSSGDNNPSITNSEGRGGERSLRC